MKVVGAKYLSDYKILINFSDHTSRAVDFADFLLNNFHPQYDKYKQLTHFRRFKIENGNIVWGNDWDLIFPVDQLHAGLIK
nr:DUF2442 domain-containing protein [uncultured Dyadobacter sp.]